MKFAHALEQLSRHNVHLATLTEDNLDDLVYSKGVPTETLIAMHEAASTLQSSKRYRDSVGPLATETGAALNLRALHGDVAARTYLAGLFA